jgi:glycosyltransferase involved in cell wall biosynthesis
LRALGLESNIRFYSQLNEAALIGLYQSASLYVCPSFYEGFGLPVLEAMSCGTAVVTTNGGALAEVAGDSAWVVPTGDSGALANAMQQLLTDDKARQHFETRGRERALAAFSWEAIAAAYEALYHQLLNQSHTG